MVNAIRWCYSAWRVTFVIAGIAASAAGGNGQPKRLNAPGYYIALDATREYEGVIRVRGASSLPNGAKIGLEVEELVPENGRKPLNSLNCASGDQRGLFRAELQVAKEFLLWAMQSLCSLLVSST